MEQTIKTGVCPNCGTPLRFGEDSKQIACPSCDNVYSPEDIIPSAGKAKLNNATQVVDTRLIELSQSVSDSEGGLVYLKHFFETFDWEEYKDSKEIEIDAITEMVERNKIKFSKNPNTYVLEFESIYTLISKKLEGLNSLAEEILNDYDFNDATNAYNNFDVYNSVAKKIIENKERYVKILTADINSAKNNGAEAPLLTELKGKLKNFTAQIEKLAEAESIQDIPLIKEHIAKIDAEKEAMYGNMGIDARGDYARALECLEAKNNKGALVFFKKIAEYKDSASYISKINRVFVFGDIISFGGKLYYTKIAKPLFSINKEEEGKENTNKQNVPELQEEVEREPVMSIYEIKEGVPAKDPIVTNISKLLCLNGDIIYYMENNKRICSYDLSSLTKTTIDDGKSGEFVSFNYNSFYKESVDGSKLLFKKQLPITFAQKKEGCLSIFKKKKVVEKVNNNYSIVAVNIEKNSLETVLPEIIDVMDYFNDEIFYTKAEELVEQVSKRHSITKTIIKFYAHSVKNGKSEELLDENSLIYNVVDGKIVYAKYTPNGYNMELRVLDIESKDDILIEKNIYDYFDVIQNKIYYKVGNSLKKSLFAINFDGTERTEIMQNVEEVSFVSGKWMYLVKGRDYNRMLIKMSIDGKKRVYLCIGLKKLVKFTNELVYYIDCFDNLCVVRSDGNNDREIAKISSKNVVVDKDYIYFVSYDYYAPNKSCKSLCRLDADGHNLKKLYYNVKDIKSYDDKYIYISVVEKNTYKVHVPAAKKKDEQEYTMDKVVTRYLAFDKASESFDNFLSVGLPTPEKVSVKSGCLKKPVDKDVIITQIIERPKRIRKDVASAGEVFEKKQESAKVAEQIAAAQKKAQGCLSSLKK